MPKRRRPRGDGYLSFDTARNRWRASVPLPGGGSRTRYFAATDQAAAEAWRQEQLAALKDKRDLRAGRQRVELALAELISDREYLRPSTRTNYRLYARHIIAAIGHIAVEDVQAQDVARMDKAHRETMAGATAAQILTLLNTLYKRLIALRAVRFNPVHDYRAITPARARKGTPLRPPVKLDAGMVRRVLDKIHPDYHAPAVWFFVLGLRWGELCGLRSVNVRDGAAHIVEQLSRKQRYEPSGLKTEDSPRTLPVPASLLSLVDLSGELVFSDEQGRPLNYNYYRKALAAACRAAGALVCRVHDSRHTAAYNLEFLGCPQHLISQYLGHRVTSQTEHYTRGPEEVLRPWVQQWAAVVVEGARPARQTA